MNWSLVCLTVLSLGCYTSIVGAQTAYPERPVRLVVPFAPGGSTSVLAVMLSKRLNDKWGQAVIVDHRPGGNTTIGTDQVAKAKPDGYTLLLTSNSHLVIPQLLSVSFDPIKDFAPIATVANTELVLVASPGLPVNSLSDLIALAKARPGQLNYASAGSSSATHLAGELLATTAHISIQHVPYKGSGPAISDLLGGQVQVSFQTPIVALPFLTSGKLKGLAVSGPSRLAAAPNVPTFTEAGIPNFQVTSWFGVMAPAGTPKAVVDKVSNDLQQIVASPEFSEKLITLGMNPNYQGEEQFGALMKSDLMRYGKIIKTSNIKLD